VIEFRHRVKARGEYDSSIRFGGNDYLDLSHHPEVIEASCTALRDHGASTCGSRVSVGTLDIHRHLESELGDFLGLDDVAVVSSGYVAAVAAFDGFSMGSCGTRTVITDDATHPSLVDGARAARAKVRTFPRRDMPALEAAIRESLDLDVSPRSVLLACDGVDGFRGELLPWSQTVALAEEYDVPLIVDDAHGIGLLGPNGRGSWVSSYVARESLLVVGSLAKAFGSSGGFVAGDAELLKAVRAGRVYAGSTALSPVAVAAARAALEIVRREPERRERLTALARRLRHEIFRIDGLHICGDNRGDSAVPVVTLVLNSPAAARSVVEDLAQRDIHVAYFTYTSGATARMVRIPLSARHGAEDIERLVEGVRASVSQVSG
jgi:8-amino-7-oxononanoate synthase